MPSPFPGMDPYLEGHLWPDVHSGLAFVIKEQLVPLQPPGQDCVLQLGKALRELYERSRYDLSIDYQEDPPSPRFSDEERAWMRGLLK